MNIPAVGIVDQDTMKFLDDAQLREIFKKVLEGESPQVVAYCGGGIAATADAFTLRRLGKENVSVYDGASGGFPLFRCGFRVIPKIKPINVTVV